MTVCNTKVILKLYKYIMNITQLHIKAILNHGAGPLKVQIARTGTVTGKYSGHKRDITIRQAGGASCEALPYLLETI